MAQRSQTVADNPPLSKIDCWSGKKTVSLDFNDWQTLFEARINTDLEASRSWAVLQSKGCAPRALKLCLFRILIDMDNEFWREEWHSTLRSITRQTALLMRRDAETLFSMSFNYVEELNPPIELPPIPIEVYGLLQEAANRLQKAAEEADAEALKIGSPDRPSNWFLPVLVSYVRRITGQKHFSHLAALVRCGCRAEDPDGKYAADAIRKAFDRFNRRNPYARKEVEKEVRRLCKDSTAPTLR